MKLRKLPYALLCLYSPLLAFADDAPLKALKSFDTTGNVIHCASLRKILAPGVRLGWMTGGRWQARIEMLKYAQSRANEALSQLAMAEFIGSMIAHSSLLTSLA